MLIKPTLESLMEKVDSKYTLTDGDAPLVDVDTTKVVSIAMEEVDQGKITYETPKTGIK